MLIDRAKIQVKAGDGGNGCTSFYRDRIIRRGRPDGGPGGRGGDIIFRADKNMHTLLDFKYNTRFKAGRGAHGSSNHKKGKAGDDRLIKVPPGTIIKDAPTGVIMRDLAAEGDKVIVAVGGKGGSGNTKHREGTPGEPGEEKEIELELKLIADIGIIGYPNVGKSTFISRISKAKSKIAGYPFTTKEPILGMVEMHGESLTFADMPGLIEGAHKGRGLGDEFLRHIERTKILLHMVDIAEVEGRNAFDDYLSINRELALYGKHLADKAQIVACNKMDLPDAKGKLATFTKNARRKIFPVSAVTGDGIKELLNEVWRVVSDV